MASIYDRYAPAPSTPTTPAPLEDATTTDPLVPPEVYHESEYQAVSAYASADTLREKKDEDDYDPEAILYRAADDGFVEKTPKKGLAQRILGWYKPVYDYKTPNLSDKERRTPRYCNGRFKRWQFILLHMAVAFVFFLVFIVPLAYFVIVPKVIQSVLNKQNISNLDLQKMRVESITSDRAEFNVKASMPAPFWLPLSAGVGECDVQVYVKGDKKNGLINVHVPGLDITLNKPLDVEMKSYVSLDHCNPDKTVDLVNKFSTDGLNDMELQVRGKFPIKAFGITWYKGLPLYLNLGHIDNVNSNLKSLLSVMPSFLKAKSVNSQIRQRFSEKDLISILTDLGFPEIHIDALDIEMNDVGITVTATVWLENPTKISLAEIEGASMGIAVENNTVARANIRKLSLDEGLQQLTLTADITFDDPAITPEKVSQTVSSTLDRLLATGDYENLKVAIVGPVKINRGDWVESITGPLALYLPMKEILDALQFPKIRSMLTLQGVSDLVGNTKLAANVLSDRVVAPVTVGLPRLLPLPQKIEIRYNVSAALYGGDQRTLGLDLHPITVLTSDTDMKIQTTVVIKPENTLPAAVALADAINPILAADPKPSSINLKQLAFFPPNRENQPFGWSNTLFGTSTIKVPLPTVICIPCLLDLLTKNGTEIPIGIQSLAIDQMTTAPGFNAQGSATLQYPPTLPELSLDVGFASLDLAVERVNAAAAVLPNGLKFIPNAGPVALNANAILSRDPALPPKLQNLVDSLLKNGSIPSSAGVTNLMFGPSQNQSFVTFSKINIELSTASLKDLVAKVMDGLKASILKPKIVQVTGADLEVVKSTQLNVGLAAGINNPLNISASLGHIDLDVLLDDGRLASLALPPLKLSLGPGGIDVKLTADIATGADGMAEKIAKLVNEVLQKQPISALFGITKLVLSPPGMRGQANPAVIDQLQTVKITAPADLINEINPLAHPDTSPIDVSNLMPSSDIIQKMNLDIQSAALETLPGASLGAGAAVGYTNPLALAAKVPFVQLTVGLGGSNVVVVQVVDITLVRGQGTLGPKVIMVFDQTDGSVPDKVAEFVENFINGHIAPSVNVKSIYFGASGADRNDLLSAVDADLSPITDGMDTKVIIDAALGMLPVKFPAKVSDLMGMVTDSLTGTLGVETLPQKTLGIDANVGLKLPFQLSLNLGYVTSKLGINANPLLGLLLQNGIRIMPGGAGGVSNVALNTALPFEDDEAAQISVGNLIANFFEGSRLDTSLDVRGVGLGYSAADTIQALSKVRLSIPLDSVIALEGPSDVFTLLNGFKPAIGGAVLETRPGNNLGVVVDMGIQMPLKIAAKVGYVGAHVGLNTLPMVDFLLPSGLVVDASGPMTALKLNTDLKFVDTEATQNAVNVLVNNLVGGRHLGAVIGVGNLAIGANAGDLITALSKVSIPADLERGLGVFGIQMPFKISSALSALHATIHRIKLHSAPNKAMLLGAAADFDLPFPVSLRLGYAAVSASMDNHPLADVVIPAGVAVLTNNSRAALNVEPVNMQFTDVRQTQEALRDFVDGFLFSGQVGQKAGVSRVFVGNSANEGDRLTILNKVDVSLSLAEVIQGAGFSIPFDITQLANSISNLGTVNVKTQPQRVLSVGAGADFNLPLPFPVDINIKHIAAKANLDGSESTGKPVCDLDVPGGVVMNTVGGNKTVGLNALLRFTDNEATRDEVAKLVDQVMNAGGVESVFGANGIQIGDSAADLITAFNLVNVRLSIARLLSQMGVELPLQFGKLASDLDLKVGSALVETRPAQTLHAGGNIEFKMPLPLSLTFETGFFFTGAELNESPLAAITLAQPLALSSLGDKRNRLNVTADIAFRDNGDTQQAVADLVDRALNSNRLSMGAGVYGLTFGASGNEPDLITIASKARITLGLDDVIGGIVDLPLDLGKLGSVALADGLVSVATKPAKTLGVAANVGLKLPFDVTATIGYFGSHIGVNSDPSAQINPLAHFALPQGLKMGGAGNLNVSTDVVFNDNDASQNDIAALVTRALNGPELAGRVSINTIQFGAGPNDLYTILNKVDARLNLDQLVKMLGLAIPLELSAVASKLDAKIANVAFGTQPGGRLDVGAKASFTLPFKVDLTVGHFATEVGVNSQSLMNMALPIRITAPASGPNVSQLDVNTTVAFNQDRNIEQLKVEVNNLVNHILSGKPDPAILNIGKVAIGASAQDIITAFSKIDAPVKLDTLLPGLGIKVPLDLTGTDLLKDISLSGDMGVKLLPGKVVGLNGTAGIKLPFNVNVRAGWAGADVGVNGAPLARAGLPLTINPDANGFTNIGLNTNLQITEDGNTPGAVAKLVKNYFGKVKLESTAGVAKIQFGASQTDVIQAFTGIDAQVPLDGIIGTDRIDLGKVLADTLQSDGLTSIKLAKVLAQFTPDNLLNLGLGASVPNLKLPIQLSANVPYVRAGKVNMDGVELADMTINNFVLSSPVAFDFDSAVRVHDSENLANMLGEYVLSLRKSKYFPGTLELGGLSAGTGPADAIMALSESVIPVMLDPVFKVLDGGLTQSGNNGGSSFALNTAADGTIAIDIKNPLIGDARITLSKAEVEFKPQAAIDSALQVGLQLAFPLTLDIPYFSIDLGLDDTAFSGVLVNGLKTTAGTNGTNSNLGVAVGLKISDTEDLAKKIAGLADALFNKQTVQGNLMLAAINVGASADNHIKAFSKVNYPFGIDKLLNMVGQTSGTISIGDPVQLIRSIGLKISNIMAKTQPGRKLNAGVTAGFNSKFPFTIKGLNYFSVNGGIDTSDLLEAVLSGLNVAPGANNINIGADLTFPKTDQDVVAKFFKDLLENAANMEQKLAVNKLKLGISEADAIKCFSLARIGIPAKTLFGGAGGSTDTSALIKVLGEVLGIDMTNMTVENFIKMLEVRRAIADLGQVGKIAVDVDVGVKNLTLNADIDLGYVSAAAALNEKRLASVDLGTGIQIKANGGTIGLALKTDIELNDSDDMATTIATIVDNVLNNQAVSDSIGVSGLSFGVSKDDSIDTFAKANIAMKMQPFVEEAKKIIQPLIDQLMSMNLAMPAGWGLDAIDLDVGDEKTLVIDIAGHSPNNGQFGLNLPYAELVVGLNGQDFVLPTIENIQLKDGRLGGHVGIGMIKNPAIVDFLGPFAGELIFHKPFTRQLEIASVKKILFGTRDQPFRILSKVAANIKIASIMQDIWNKMNANQIQIDDIRARITDRGFAAHVKVPLNVSLPVNFKFGMTEADIKYRVGGAGKVYHVSGVEVPKLTLGQTGLLEFDIAIIVDIDAANGVIEPLYEALERLLTFTSFSEHAILGYARLHGSNGKVFDVLDQLAIPAPDLTLWEPLTIALPVPLQPIATPGLSPLPFGAEIWWPNQWSFDLVIGYISIEVRNGNNDLIRIASPQVAEILNKNNGGTVKGTKDLKLGLYLPIDFKDILKKIFNPIGAIKEFFDSIRDLLNPKAYDLAISINDPNNQELKWFTTVMDIVFTKRFLGRSLIPILGAILVHSSVQFFGHMLKLPFINLEDLPFIKPLVQEADRILAGVNPKVQFRGALGGGNSFAPVRLTAADWGLEPWTLPANFSLDGNSTAIPANVTMPIPSAAPSSMPLPSASPAPSNAPAPAPAPSNAPAPAPAPSAAPAANTAPAAAPSAAPAARRLRRRNLSKRLV